MNIQEMKEISLFLNIMSEKEMNKTFNMSNRMLEHLFHAMHQNQAKAWNWTVGNML